jgi:hypothetical protein
LDRMFPYVNAVNLCKHIYIKLLSFGKPWFCVIHQK